MPWGTSPNANERVKIKSDMADYLKGLNSVGQIDYDTLSVLFDFSMEMLDKMHELGKNENKEKITANMKENGKMNLVIYKNELFEEEFALYDTESGEVILKGDCYHDKISYQIKGYLLALKIDEDAVPEIWINNEHELYAEAKNTRDFSRGMNWLLF